MNIRARSLLCRTSLGAAVLLVALALLGWGQWKRGADLLRYSSGEDAFPTGHGAAYHELILPSVDTGHWIVQTEQMREQGLWRLRNVDYDNAPLGRPDEWASPPHWLLASGAALARSLGICPSIKPMESAALFVGPVMLLVFVAGAYLLAWRLWGLSAAFAAAFGTLVAPGILDGFEAGGFDHHMLVAFSTFFCIAGLLAGFMAAEQGRDGRWYLLISALAGAFGIWISAVSQVPVIAFLGLASFCVARMRRTDEAFVHAVIRSFLFWCRAGAVFSLLAYLVEYAPALLRLRLDVNNPLYALSWLAAGELFAAMLRAKSFRRWGWRAWLSVVVLPLPILLLIVAGKDSFMLIDPALRMIHEDSILEFWSPFRLMRTGGLTFSVWRFALAAIILVWGLARVFGRGAEGSKYRMQLVMALIPALMLDLLVLWQYRWFIEAESASLVLLAMLCGTASAPLLWRRALMSLAVLSALVFSVRRAVVGEPFTKEYSFQLVERGLAQNLFLRGGGTAPICLAGPRISSFMMYYGGARVLGTLYWENIEGLKRAADIYSASDEQEALRLLRKAEVRYLIVTSWDRFEAKYVKMAKVMNAGFGGKSYLRDAIMNARPPAWLRPLPIYLPSSKEMDKEQLLVFEVVPERTEAQALQQYCELLVDMKNPAALGQVLPGLAAQARSDVPSQITLVRVLMVLKKTEYVGPAADNLFARVGQGTDLSTADRVRLAGLMAALGHKSWAQTQFAILLRDVTEADLLTFPPDVARDFRMLGVYLDMTASRPDLFQQTER
ncbi:MAG: hypothetical protein WC360_01595 [Opitutales bacterium]|jgi:hypothetical protein